MLLFVNLGHTLFARGAGSQGQPRDFDSAYIDFYNSQRPHQSLDYKTPDEVYVGGSQRTVDMMDKPDGLPTSPQVQQHQSGDKIYLEQAA